MKTQGPKFFGPKTYPKTKNEVRIKPRGFVRYYCSGKKYCNAIMTAPTGREGAFKNAFAPSLPVGAVNIFCQTYNVSGEGNIKNFNCFCEDR